MGSSLSKLDLSTSGVHGRAELADCFHETDEDRATDHRVADVQLFDFGDRGNWPDVFHGQPVPRMHRESELGATARGVAQCANRRGVARGVRVRARVQLDRDGAECM